MYNSFGNIYGMHRFWWALIILLILGLIFYLLDIQKRKRKKENPLEALKRRFAKGEISKEEFENSKRILNI